MTYLAENSVPIWVGGFVLVFLAVVTYLNLRTTRSLLLIPGSVLVVAGLLWLEWIVETPREAVERTLYELADAIEADDMQTTLTYIAPSATEIRADVEAIMPRVTVEKANVVDMPKIDVDSSAVPPKAVVLVRGFIDATENRGGMKAGVLEWIHVSLVYDGQRWQVTDYTPPDKWGHERERFRSQGRTQL